MPPAPTPQHDQRFEALFTRWNLHFEFVPDLSLTDDLSVIDEAQVRDLSNIGAPERVDQYALQMRNGASFPPIVMAAELLGRFDVLIDGNTRALAARKIKHQTFPAYRVSPVPDVDFAKMLAAALNQLGGQRLTPAEANKAALVMMDLGWQDEAVARELGYSAESVRRWRREVEFGDRSERCKVEEWSAKLTKTQRQQLAKVKHDGPFTEAVKLVADTRPSQPDLQELLGLIDKAGSDEEAIAAVRKAREDWQPIGPEPRQVHRNRPAQQARMHIGGLLKLDPLEVYDPTKAAEDAEKWREVRALVDRILSVYDEHGRKAA